MTAVTTATNVTTEDVLKLAALARLDIPESQLESVRHDIGAILAYVEGIREAGAKLEKTETGEIHDIHMVTNVLREDTAAHESGIYTDTLLNSAPEREGGYVKVKKILSNDN